MKIPRLIQIQANENCTLDVVFDDNTIGKIDFLNKNLPGVLNQLKAGDFFSKVELLNGVVCWPNEIDISGDSLYLEIKGITYEEWKKKQLINA